MSIEPIAAASAGIALISARISWRNLKEQKRVTKYAAAYTYLSAAEAMFRESPELMRLHGLDLEVLEELRVSKEEVVYLINSFTGADLYHRIEGNWPAELTTYRKNLLDNPTVQKVWEKIIRKRFVSEGTFSDAVDEYLLIKNQFVADGGD